MGLVGFLRAALVATAILPAAGSFAHAKVADCARSPAQIFATTGNSVVEIFSIAINPFLVSDRIIPRGGSGYVMEDGYVITNYHVVADAKTVVVTYDGTGVEAEVVGIDPTLDIAVLRPYFMAPDAKAIRMAGDADIMIGQTAYTIGFPLGLGKTISTGIVSGYGRVLPITTSSWLSPFVQTDAAISPGSSGGALVDSCGRLIGMITMGVDPGRGENVGFAIPVSVLRPVIDELIRTGKVARPWHGLYGQFVTPPILLMLGIPAEAWEENTGFLVETVEPGSAADRVGLRGGSWPVNWGGTQILLGGEIITHVNDIRIDSLETALNVVRSLKIGDMVHLVGVREAGRFEVSVTLEERPLLREELELYR
ncbi:S1C family serine protease [Ostreiculturibacter nitratireducens]|uniref:S1C family serine protease n=1 Tax=Ostreiculturibacter nitratireducens TaxID=3075226 RepID=UPI0031B6139B